jgi:predicted RNA binding protein YcfA (HicA-like mRNA interferase family)
MTRQISIQKLSKILRKLGFERKEVSGSHITFFNPSSNAIIMLPIGRNEIGIPHIRMVEKTLEEKAIIGREDFENLLVQP